MIQLVQAIATSTLHVLHLGPNPIPAPAERFFDKYTAALITFTATVFAALITALVAIRLGKRNRQLERQKLVWEREKLQLTWEREAEAMQAAKDRTRQLEEDADRNAKEAAKLKDAEAADDGRAYCTKLAQTLSQLKILDMSRPLSLNRIYVKVRIREQQHLRFATEEELESDDSSRSNPGRQWPRERTVKHLPISPQEAIRRYHHLVILGDPGAGKTTMLKHVAYSIAQRNTQAEIIEQLPIYVELRKYVDSGSRSILEYIGQLLESSYGLFIAPESLLSKFEHGSVVLLLDGLDEILGDNQEQSLFSSTYDAVTSEITAVCGRFPLVSVAVTCRRHGWKEGLPAFRNLEALDFEWEQISEFIGSWFAEMPGKARSLRRTLQANYRLRTLSTNPLLLSLIAIVYERDLELPERRAALYRRCVDVLLREWDSHRQIRRQSKFTTDRKQDLLKQIAWHYHVQGKRYFAKDDLLAQIAGFLPTIDIEPSNNEAILDEIAAQYGLLKAQAHGWYGFLHLTLQEHFAAAALLERGNDGIEEIFFRRYDTWWEEVILLFSGGTPDAGPLLRHLAGVGENGEDDIFRTGLLLAGRCLAGSPRVTNPTTRSLVLDQLRHFIAGAPTQFDASRAADVLVEISTSDAAASEIVNMICSKDQKMTVRISLVRAVAESGNSDFAARLLAVAPRLQAEPALFSAVLSAFGQLSFTPADGFLQEIVSVPDTGTNQHFERAAVVHARTNLALIRGNPKEILAAFESTDRYYGNSGSNLAAIETIASTQPDLLLDAIVSGSVGHYAMNPAVQTYLESTGSFGLDRIIGALEGALPTYCAQSISRALASYIPNSKNVESVGHRLTSLLERNDLDEIVGWYLSECLDQYPFCVPDLSKALNSAAAFNLRTVGIAATLTTHNSPHLDVLEIAVKRRLHAADLHYRGTTYSQSGAVWRRILPLFVRFDRERGRKALIEAAENFLNPTRSKRRPTKATEASIESRRIARQRPDTVIATGMTLIDVNRALDMMLSWGKEWPGRVSAMHGWRAEFTLDEQLHGKATKTLAHLVAVASGYGEFRGFDGRLYLILSLIDVLCKELSSTELVSALSVIENEWPSDFAPDYRGALRKGLLSATGRLNIRLLSPGVVASLPAPLNHG